MICSGFQAAGRPCEKPPPSSSFLFALYQNDFLPESNVYHQSYNTIKKNTSSNLIYAAISKSLPHLSAVWARI